MAWETRGGGGRRYYYTATRIGGRVVKHYCGTAQGEQARLFARLDQITYEEQREKQSAERAEIAALRSAEQEAAQQSRTVQTATQLLLRAAGYHRPGRWKWRKRRSMAMTLVMDPADTAVAAGAAGALEPLPQTVAARRELLTKALQNPKDKRLKALAVRALREYPEETGTAFLDQLAPITAMGEHEVAKQFARSEAQSLIEKIAPKETSSVVERLLAHQLAADQAHLVSLERHYTQMAANGGMSLQKGDFYEKAISRAHKRYLATIRTLAEVRRLQLPQLPQPVIAAAISTAAVQIAQPGQVNVAAAGGQQVNVAAP